MEFAAEDYILMRQVMKLDPDKVGHEYLMWMYDVLRPIIRKAMEELSLGEQTREEIAREAMGKFNRAKQQMLDAEAERQKQAAILELKNARKEVRKARRKLEETMRNCYEEEVLSVADIARFSSMKKAEVELIIQKTG